MSDLVNRTVDELIARYEFEPSLKDVIVEGSYDCDLLISSQGGHSNDIFVYSIETVDIPLSLLTKYSLTSGHKQRVMVLAKELELNLDGNFSYLCLIDRDLDHWFGELEKVKNLKWTKYTSIEMHFYEDKFIRHLLCTVCKAKFECYTSFIESFSRVLQKIYAFRCVDNELKLNLNWVAFEKCLSFSNGKIELDLTEYVLRVMNKNSRSNLKSEIENKIEDWYKKFDRDFRQSIRGHDFVELLAWVVKRAGGIKEVSTTNAIYRLLVGASLNNSALASELTV